jgi:multiple sugar transport system permease protein
MFKTSAICKKKNTPPTLLFITPALVIILGIVFYPIVKSIVMSFTNRLFTYLNYSYIGLENYIDILHDSMFWQSFWNSAKLTFWNVASTLVIGLALALLLNSSGKVKGWFRGLLFLPWAVPSIVVSIMFRWLYNDIYGLPNYFLTQHHIIDHAVNPLANSGTAWVAIMIPIIWNYFPFVMLVFLSALQSIEPHLYHAAEIDGANRWQTFLHITLPALKPAVFIVVILQSLWSFSEFALIFLLSGGGPADATQTLSIYIFEEGFGSKMLGYASALGTVMFLILIIFTLLFAWVNKKSRI